MNCIIPVIILLLSSIRAARTTLVRTRWKFLVRNNNNYYNICSTRIAIIFTGQITRIAMKINFMLSMYDREDREENIGPQ